MVIFTNVPEKIAKLCSHATDCTVIIPMEIDDVEVRNDIHISDEQWENEKINLRQTGWDVNLYKVWAGKSWIVNQALQLDPFSSSVYNWMDIGRFCGSGELFCGETVVCHPEIVPDDGRIICFL